MVASPPTKTSLSTWWKQFKQRQLAEDASSSSGSDANSSSNRLTPPAQRPVLRHMSHSSGAVETVKSNGDGRGGGGAGGGVAGTSGSPAPQIPPEVADSPIFGVPLETSVKYASVSISLSDTSGDEFVYGRIPVVVGKCGVYLKKNATKVEGIFRLSGSARRIKELQIIFSSPPRFGKGLNWDGFNVHDAANVLRRYLNRLPEPIVPLAVYETFREPLRARPAIVEYLQSQSQQAAATAPVAPLTIGSPPQLVSPPLEAAGTTAADIHNLLARHQQAGGSAGSGLGSDDDGDAIGTSRRSGSTASPNAPSSPNSSESTTGQHHPPDGPAGTPLFNDISTAVDVYMNLIAELPPLNRQLLMYILDMLSIFAARADDNRMPASNLAAIFQPSILSHPDHDMKPQEYHLSRAVIEFLIQHSNKFLSHVERQAIAEYEARKKAGLVTKSGGGVAQTAAGPATGSPSASPYKQTPPTSTAGPSGGSSTSGPVGSASASTGAPHHRRRHSKSMSSVHGPPTPPNGGVLPPRQNPYSQTRTASGSSERLIPLAVPRQRQGSGGGGPSDDTKTEGGGFLSSLKRNVSLSRRPSQRRSGSASSAASGTQAVSQQQRTASESTAASVGTAGSDALRSYDPPAGDQGSIPEITVADPDNDAHTRTGRSTLSALFSRRSKSPSGRSDDGQGQSQVRPQAQSQSQSQAQLQAQSQSQSQTQSQTQSSGLSIPVPPRSIDETLAASPGTESSIHSPSRHHWSLHSVFSGKNDSTSSFSNLGRTFSGASSDGGAAAGYDDSAHPGEPSSPRKKEHVSRWRRSLMAFSFNDIAAASSSSIPSTHRGDHPDSADYPDTTTVPPHDAQLSPASSAGRPQSPSRASVLFSKMRLRDRSTSRERVSDDPSTLAATKQAPPSAQDPSHEQ